MIGSKFDLALARIWALVNAWYDAQTVVQQLTEQRERAYEQVYRLMREKAELQEKLDRMNGVDDLLGSSFTVLSERFGSRTGSD